MGGDAYNVEAWAALFGIDPAQLTPRDDGTDIEDLLEAMRPDPVDRDDAYRTMPLGSIAAIAHCLAQVAPALLEQVGVADVPASDIEEMCTMFAPWAAYQVALLAPRLFEFGLDARLLPPPLRGIVGEVRTAARVGSIPRPLA